MSILVVLLTILFAIVCVMLVGIVLLQPSQADSGLSGAFGGGGGGDSFFGTKAVSAAARITIILASLFIGLALLLNAKFMHKENSLMRGESSGTEKIQQPPQPPQQNDKKDSSDKGAGS